MSNTDKLGQELEKADVKLPGEEKIKVVKKTWPENVSGPYVATHDIMVSDVSKFHLPEESYKFFGLDLQKASEGYYVAMQYSSVNHPEPVESWPGISPEGIATIFINYNTVITKRDTDTTNNIRLDTPYYISTEDFIAMNGNKGAGWEFNNNYTTLNNADGQHPGIKFSLAVGQVYQQQFKDPGFKTEMTVLYNNAPSVYGPTVVTDFSEIKARDNNNDYVPAFEIKLVNEDLIGKVGLVTYDSKNETFKTHPIGAEGVRYSQTDRSISDMKLVRLDGFTPGQQGLAANHVRLKVRACDSYAWGETSTFHVPLSN